MCTGDIIQILITEQNTKSFSWSVAEMYSCTYVLYVCICERASKRTGERCHCTRHDKNNIINYLHCAEVWDII